MHLYVKLGDILVHSNPNLRLNNNRVFLAYILDNDAGIGIVFDPRNYKNFGINGFAIPWGVI
jgi:hypothetical protein